MRVCMVGAGLVTDFVRWMGTVQTPWSAPAAARTFRDEDDSLHLHPDDHCRADSEQIPGVCSRGARLHPELLISINRKGTVLSSGPLQMHVHGRTVTHAEESDRSMCWLGLGARIDRNGNFVSQ